MAVLADRPVSTNPISPTNPIDTSMSKKAKTCEASETTNATNAFNDSDDEDRARSPSPSRRKTPSTPSQEADHAAAKASRAAVMVSKQEKMKALSRERALSGRAPKRVQSGSNYGEATMNCLVLGYQEVGNKMHVMAVPISAAAKTSFDFYGSENPYMSAMISTHRPRDASRESKSRADGSTYMGAFPKTLTYIPNDSLFPGWEGMIGCASMGALRKLNQFMPTAFVESASGSKSSVNVPLPVGSKVTFKGMSGEDTTMYGYNPKKGNPAKNEPGEDPDTCATRVKAEYERSVTDRKIQVKFKSVETGDMKYGRLENVLTDGKKYMAVELIDALYNNGEFQRNVTEGLIAAHAGWQLKEFNAEDYAEEDVQEKKLEYDGAAAAVAPLIAMRKDTLSKTAAQLKRNLQEIQKPDNLRYHNSEPGAEQKIKLLTDLARELELAAAGEESLIKPWDMPYRSDRYMTTLVFKDGGSGYGKHSEKMATEERKPDVPKTFTDFYITNVYPKSNGYGYIFHVHTTTVSDSDVVFDQLAKNAMGALLDSRAPYSPNEGYPALELSCNDGALSVAWKVQSMAHLPIVASMMTTAPGNGIISTYFAPRRPGYPEMAEEKNYVEMVLPDVIGKLQGVGLKVSAEWLKTYLCSIEEDDGDNTYILYPVPLDEDPEKNRVYNVDVSKSSAFSRPTSTLMEDTFINLHELSTSIEFDKLAKRDKTIKDFVKENNYHLEYRILVPLDADGGHIDITAGVEATKLEHMREFAQLSTNDAEALIEKAAGGPDGIGEFLKLHTIPYAFLLNDKNETV